MSDDEIQALERRIAQEDLAAWPLLDAALVRASLPPRRVWTVVFEVSHGETWHEDLLAPIHMAMEGAIKHMHAFAVSEGAKDYNLVSTGKTYDSQGVPGEDLDEYEGSKNSRLYIFWTRLDQ